MTGRTTVMKTFKMLRENIAAARRITSDDEVNRLLTEAEDYCTAIDPFLPINEGCWDPEAEDYKTWYQREMV